jgi:hypothetical protein
MCILSWAFVAGWLRRPDERANMRANRNFQVEIVPFDPPAAVAR